MNTYKKSENNSLNGDLMGRKRQERALREFKEVLQNLVLMLRRASGMETVYLYWINRDRRQFVMETKSTEVENAVFQDRLAFDEYFLEEYRDIREPVRLELGRDISQDAISHYYGNVPVRHITLLPFVNNEETVAITVVESSSSSLTEEQGDVIRSYTNALGNVLHTYLEMSDLYEHQNEWAEYEDRLDFLSHKGHYAGLLAKMLDTIQGYLQQGGASLVVEGMNAWSNVLNASAAKNPIPLGLPVEKRSVAKDALESGEPEFSIHFNRNPKRLSPRELNTEGATLAIPILFNDYRKGVVMVYEENPLVFKESTKHKLINIVRLTNLKIQAQQKNGAAEAPLLANEYGALLPDLWERAVDAQIERLTAGDHAFHTWVAMVTPSDLSQIRTQLRLEELKYMQKAFVQSINPARYGVPGYVGYHADYVYTVILQGQDPDAVEHWVDQVREVFESPFELLNGRTIETGIDIGYKEICTANSDSYEVISAVKKELSRRVNTN